MALDDAIRSVHIVAAALWVGSAFFMAFILGPTLAKVGPAAGPLMSAIMRRGGLSPFFMIVAFVTVLAGGYTYWKAGYSAAPFATAGNSMVTIGMVLGVLALLDGLFILVPNERKIKALVLSMPEGKPPAPEQMAKMQELGAKQGKGSAISAGLLTIALLLMAFHTAV